MSEAVRGTTIWLTGLPSAGKTTLGRRVVERLRERDERVELLDGDEMRAQLGSELGFSREDREKNMHRIAFVAELLTRHGVTVVVAAICPYIDLRRQMRERLSPFVEVFVNAPVEVCEQRDVKGLYRRSRAGELKGLTGVDSIYEPPLEPEVECRTNFESIEESTEKILEALRGVAVKGGAAGLNHRHG